MPRMKTCAKHVTQRENHTAIMLLALALAGGTTLLLWPPLAPHPTQSPTHLQPYSQIPALLTQARTQAAPLALPHAHWFVRVRHGRAKVVVQDGATQLNTKSSVHSVAPTGDH
jgi:hypothetical protein